MTWLVFGVSCLLVLAGAVSIISGAPIIQLERGWAEVIAGTVALSSGGVVFALAGILMRLESIRDAVAARALPVTAETTRPAPLPAPEPLPAAPETRSEPVTVPSPLPAEPAAEIAATAPRPEEDDRRTEGLWKRVKRPEVERPVAAEPDADDLRQHGFPDRVVPDEQAPAAPMADTRVLVPAHPVPIEAPAVEVAPIDNAQDTAPTEPDIGQIGWLERSLFKGRAARDGGAPSRAEPSLERLPVPRAADQDAGTEPAHASDGDTSAARTPLPPAPMPSAAAEPAPTPDISSEQHEGATVIGRYQAGSASYVMYSDGTIEVETESGEIHRFGSMDELKAFIAQQDTTVS